MTRKRSELTMKTLKLLNYARDSWIAGDGTLAEIAAR